MELESIVLNWNKLATDHLKFKNYKESLALLTKAETLLNEVKKPPGRLLTITYNNLGLFYKNTQKYDLGLQYFQKALQISWNTSQSMLDSAGMRLNIWSIYSKCGRHNTALKHAKEAMSQLKVLVKEMPDDKNLNTTTLIAYWQMGRQSEAINCPFEAKRYYEEGVNFAMLHAPQNKLLRNLDEALARINQRSRPRLKRTRIQCKLMSPSTALIRRSFSSEKKTVRARSQNSRYSKNNESLQTTQRSQIQNIRTAVLPKLKTVPESLQRSIQELNSNISRLEKHIANSPQLKKRFTNSPEIKTARVLATEKVLRRPSTRQLQTWWRDVSRGSRKITSPKIVNAVFRGYKVRRNMKNLSR